MPIVWRLLAGTLGIALALLSIYHLASTSDGLGTPSRGHLLTSATGALVFLAGGLNRLSSLGVVPLLRLGIVALGLVAELMIDPPDASVPVIVVGLWVAGLSIWIVAMARSLQR